MTDFPKAPKKSLYVLIVKVLSRALLLGVPGLRWYGAFATGSSCRGSWRFLCKPPIEKYSADLQWRVVHGAVATDMWYI